ncbi:MAG: polyribonucleotide nucleotidyltransferase, partial [Patescibacteria group bacterium]|nr:polyribonucleotide nucleotidyltransferase [Patescibacteria group bacterium]
PYRVNRVEDVVKQGDPLRVRVMEIDDRGRVNLSHKVCLPDGDKNITIPPRDPQPDFHRDDHRDNRRDDRRPRSNSQRPRSNRGNRG